MIKHHPELELLGEYASGALPEPVALIVACHASLCRDCRDQIARLELIGGALLERIVPVSVAEDALARTFARIERPETSAAPAPEFDAETRAAVPAPARRYLGRGLNELKWRWHGPGLQQAIISLPRRGYRLSLLRMKPGAAAPHHTHRGHEYTMVLQGGFTDASGHYDRGDFALADSSISHVPVADEEGCLCLAVLDAPLKLSGPFGAILNRFLRF